MRELYPSLHPNDKGYLGKYQTHLKAITDDLSENELQDLKDAANEWNQSKPPEDIQRR
jgi:hypothetical protein